MITQRLPVTASSYRVDRIGMQFDDCMPSYVVSRVFSANLPTEFSLLELSDSIT